MPDATGSEMSTSMNSDASYDIDIVRHHDGVEDINCLLFLTYLFSVATSTANLLDATDTDSDSESEEETSRYGKQKDVRVSIHFRFKSLFRHLSKVSCNSSLKI